MASVTPEKPSAVDVLHCVRTSPLGDKLQRVVAEVWKASVLLCCTGLSQATADRRAHWGP